MPVQFAPNILSPEEELGKELSTGLSQGLEGLAQQGMEQLKQRQLAQRYQRMGISPDLAYAPQNIQQFILKELSNRPNMGGFLGAQQQNEVPGMPQESAMPTQGGVDPFDIGARLQQPTKGDIQRNEELGLKREKTDLERQRLNLSARQQIAKPLEDAYQKGRDAKTTRQILRQLKTLSQTGQLRLGPAQALAERLDQFIPGLKDLYQTAPEQFAEKLIAQFGLGAQSAFKGGRMTNFLLDTYMKMFPSLSKKPAAFEAMIDSLDIAGRLDEMFGNELSRLEKDYQKKGEALPGNLLQQAAENLESKSQKLMQKQIEKLHKPFAPPKGSWPKKLIPNKTVMTDETTGFQFIYKDGNFKPYLPDFNEDDGEL